MENLLVVALFGAGWVAWSTVCVVSRELAKRRGRRLAAAWQLAGSGAVDDARREFRALAACRNRRIADYARWGLAWLRLITGAYDAAAEAFAELRDEAVFDEPWRSSFFAEAGVVTGARDVFEPGARDAIDDLGLRIPTRPRRRCCGHRPSRRVYRIPENRAQRVFVKTRG